MAVSFATAANGIAAPTPPSGADEPIGVDSLYLSDFAEDLTLAIGRATASDATLATGLPVMEQQGRDPSMQAGLGEGGLQVLPLQVLNQAINRAILASAGDPATLAVQADDMTESVVAIAAEDVPAALFPSVQDVLSQWESRYFNVARADTQPQPMGADGVAPADTPVAEALHVVAGEVVTDQAIVNAALQLAQPESDALGAQAPTGEALTATASQIAELALNAGQQMPDVAAPPVWSVMFSVAHENADDSSIQHSISPNLSDSSADESATSAKSALVGVKADLGVSHNRDGVSVLGGMLVDRIPHQLSVEQSNIEGQEPLLASSLDRGSRLSSYESQRLIESRADSKDESLTETVVGSEAILEAGLAIEGESRDTRSVENVVTLEPTSQLWTVPAALAGQPNVVTTNVTDALLPSSDTDDSVSEIGRFVARNTLPGDVGFPVATASKDAPAIATARPLTEEATPSTASRSSVALPAANLAGASRVALTIEAERTTWLDGVRRDDAAATSSVELMAVKAIDSKSAPMMPSGSVMSGPSLSPGFASQAPPQVADSLVMATGVASIENKGESQSQRQRLDSVASAVLAASSIMLGASNEGETGASIGNISPDRLASAFVGPVAQRSDRHDSIDSDDAQAVTDVQLTDGEQVALGRAATESSLATGLSSTVGFSSSTGLVTDRFSVAAAQSQVATAGSQSTNPLVNNVSIEVKQLLTSGGGSVRMALTPPEQGTLQLDLVVTDSGAATLEVYGVTEAVRERLENGSTALQRQFEQMGLTLSLSLFDHSKGSDSLNTRDSQVMAERLSDAPAESTSRVTKRSGTPVGDDTGRMINLIA